ncbi:MAG TPA: MASE1 domain-containing protein, partial [Methylomirabilota bacterium]|nr:MASE1 domain-containing protein [Methylomirabilota bacterium]
MIRHWSLVAAVTAVYFLAGKLGLYFASMHPSSSAVWPPAGIALAALLLFGPHMWRAVFAGAFLVNVTTVGSMAASLGIATGNTLEAVVGAALVTRFAGGRRAVDRAPDIFKLALLAGLLSTTISATFGVTALVLGGFASPVDYGSVWLTWWLGDAAGDVIVAPAILLLSDRRGLGRLRERPVEAVLLLAAI